MARLRRRARRGRRGGLARPLEGVPPPGANRPGVDRPAVGGASRRRDGDRDRAGTRVRHRRTSDDAALRRAAARARARQPRRPRLRLGRALRSSRPRSGSRPCSPSTPTSMRSRRHARMPQRTASQVEVMLADVLTDELPRSHVALANITRPTLEARRAAAELAPADQLRLSADRCERARQLSATFDRITRDSWAADLYEAAE